MKRHIALYPLRKVLVINEVLGMDRIIAGQVLIGGRHEIGGDAFQLR